MAFISGSCYTVGMKNFFKNLEAVLFPPPKRNDCPHCGGTRCFGMCSVTHEKNGENAAEQKKHPGLDEKKPPSPDDGTA